jgi:hypothetical protein
LYVVVVVLSAVQVVTGVIGWVTQLTDLLQVAE